MQIERTCQRDGCSTTFGCHINARKKFCCRKCKNSVVEARFRASPKGKVAQEKYRASPESKTSKAKYSIVKSYGIRPTFCSKCKRKDKAIEFDHCFGYEGLNQTRGQWICSACHSEFELERRDGKNPAPVDPQDYSHLQSTIHKLDKSFEKKCPKCDIWYPTTNGYMRRCNNCK